ncbi:MAG TPA: hypothetical protein VG675_22635, partial [Bryobacteraceae bacterium]|nr:hypothetical protein [Bryobacteraceae bacterium]
LGPIQVDRFDRRFWDFSGSLHILSLKQTETFSAPNVLNSRDFFTDPPESAFWRFSKSCCAPQLRLGDTTAPSVPPSPST